MTDSEKITKVIEYAIEKGWKKNPHLDSFFVVEIIIFSHNFARAVFGEEPVSKYRYTIGEEAEKMVIQQPDNIKKVEFVRQHFYILSWQYHLQQAVISEDPIDYYYQYITNSDKSV